MGFFPYAVGTGGNGALPGGALFLWRNSGKNTKGKEVPSPWNPILWWEERGKVVPSGRGLACGLQDQRLMARPPARAGGRSGLLTEGKTGTRTVTLCLFPKGTHPRPQPAQPVGGPLRAFQCEGRRPGNQREVQLPPTQPHQRRESRGKNLFPLGFFPPFLPKKWGPGRAGQGSLPFQRRPKGTPPPPERYSYSTPR